MDLLEELEDARSLPNAGIFFPSRPSARTVLRWAREGLHGVVLETWRSGGKLVTTRAAALRFLERLNSTRPRDPQVDAAETAARGREASAALDKLRA